MTEVLPLQQRECHALDTSLTRFALCDTPFRRASARGGAGPAMKKRQQVHNHPEMTPQELARCRPASEVDELGLPIPTHLVSNEEYFPPFLQTARQQQVEARVLDAL